jgi:hypothetical protein
VYFRCSLNFHPCRKADHLFRFSFVPSSSYNVFLRQKSVEEKYGLVQLNNLAPLSLSCTIISAQSLPGGNAPTPSLLPGSLPSASIISTTFALLLRTALLTYGPLRPLLPLSRSLSGAWTEGDLPFPDRSSPSTVTS